MKAEELAFKTHELTQKLRRTPMPLADLVPHLQEMADELRRLAALEKEGNDDLTIAYLSGHSKGAADTKAKLEQAITDPENQPSQYGTITLDEHEKKVSAITEKYSDAVDRFVKEREKVFALEQAAEPVGWMTESEDGKTMLWPTFAEALTYCDEDERPIPLYTHPAPQSAQQAAEPVAIPVDATPDEWRNAAWKIWKAAREHQSCQGIPSHWIDTFRTIATAHPAPRKPMTRDDMRKMLAEHFDNGDLTGADFSLIRAVERFHQIKG